MLSLHALVLCVAAWQETRGGEPMREVEVLAANGRFVAQLRKAAGQERVADALARWRLTVLAVGRDGARSEFWSCVARHRAGQRAYFVSDDGLAFVEVEPAFDRRQDLVRVWRDQRELAALGASALGVEVAREARGWLLPEGGASLGWLETPSGPVPQLWLALAAGGERRVDLQTGEVFSTREWVSQVAVGPAVEEEFRRAAQAPFVERVSAPARVAWGEVLEIAVSGSHPTPNWRCAGFEGRVEGEDGARLVLTALSSPPPPNSVAAQVLEKFQIKASIAGLRPGRYQIQVIGRESEHAPAVAVEVTAARALLELSIRGGILGLDDSIRLYASGVAVASWSRGSVAGTYQVLDAEDRRLLDLALRELPREPRDSRSVGADMFEYTLRWSAGNRELAWRFDDGSADAVGRELVRVLRGIAERGRN